MTQPDRGPMTAPWRVWPRTPNDRCTCPACTRLREHRNPPAPPAKENP